MPGPDAGRGGADQQPAVRHFRAIALVIGCTLVAGAASTGAIVAARNDGGRSYETAQATTVPTTTASPPTTSAPATSAPTKVAAAPGPPPFEGWVDPASVGKPYYTATVPGLFTFRGN
jgi:hypothetical protein